MGEEKSKAWYNTAYQADIVKKGSTYMKLLSQTHYIKVWEKVIEVINQKNYRAVLDIGCGPGQFGKLCLDRRIGYLGWDFSDKAIKMAQKMNPGHENRFKICGDIQKMEHITFPGAITMCEVLEHITYDIHVLNRIFCKLLIFTVPNYDYKSHVRHFVSEHQIRARYAEVVPIDEIIPIETEGKHVIYIVIIDYEKSRNNP